MIKYISLIMIVLAFTSCKRAKRTDTNTHSVHSNKNVMKESKTNSNVEEQKWKGNTSVKMTKRNGVYEVPIKINDVNMNIIFDTGASSISISETEALFLLKQGKITKEDILGKQNFQDATGNISEGTIINLQSVQIGDRKIYNVKASVIPNMNAPLLLGQSALSKFGKLTIDYNTNTIRFE